RAQSRATRSSPRRAGPGRRRVRLERNEWRRPALRPLAQIYARLPHQIKDRTAVWPFLPFFGQSRPQRVLLHVIPFLAIVFSRSKVAIKIFRLPDRRCNIQRAVSCRELTLFHICIHFAIGCAIVARRAKK